MADGDVPGGTGGGSNAAGGDGEEAVWLDLIARFTAPGPDEGESPWPDREDLAEGVAGLGGLGPVSVTPSMPETLPDALPREPPTNPTGLPGLPLLGSMADEQWSSAGTGARRSGTGPRDMPIPDDLDDDHYVPPIPPPLPKIDPVTKFAWLALFGGPLYLLISTAVGATITGLAAFLAVAAFVTGFVVLVLRMDNSRPPDSGPDDGAVV